jgi:hypothetical protein
VWRLDPPRHHVTDREDRCVQGRPALGEVVGELCAPRLRIGARPVEGEGALDGVAGRGILADDDADLEDAGPPFA